ncbi:MAG: benzoyl-CoA reductase subunit A [Deltaproteobacteria bacterium]|nr:benzoyl-CoA reductase subunit A [Deltaproteobacteria bacterium]
MPPRAATHGFPCFVGIDLGSTTSKAVVLDEDGRILGRGITNSRSNYDLACRIARDEAFVDAQMTRLARELAADPVVEPHVSVLRPSVERSFRYRQHVRQLATLRRVCFELAAGQGTLEGALAAIFDEMEREAETMFSGLRPRPSSEFFRDVAGGQFQALAEKIAAERRVPFETVVGVLDRAMPRVENEPDDLSFEGNARDALGRALGRYAKRSDVLSAAVSAALDRVIAEPPFVVRSVGTGYGRARLPFPKEQIRSEILCHGLGAHATFPQTRTVLDIGGQDTKAVQVDADGVVTGFQMNDRCAAGCGRYLGYVADEMGLGVHELGPLAAQASHRVRISSTCTVFAGAELRDRLALGEKREDILAGLHRAILLRAMSLLARSGGVREELTFTGGVASNQAAVAALRELVDEHYGEGRSEPLRINVSPDSIFTGARGAALFALRGPAAGPARGEKMS